METYGELDLFNFNREKFELGNRKVRTIEFFGGIGSTYKALKLLLGERVEHYKLCEWAYKSIIAYNTIHLKDLTDYAENKSKNELIERIKGISWDYNEPMTEKQIEKKGIEWIKSAYNNVVATHNLINIMNVKGKDLEIVEKDKYVYVASWSFPCQDLSNAGLQKGLKVSQKDGGTRSGLCHEFLRIIEELEQKDRPQVLLMENVPDLIHTKFVKDFCLLREKLEELGYTNYIQVLNAKDYGIPQNRKRVFMLSLLGDYAYDFPKKMPLKYNLGDLLQPEEEVDEKYYLSEKMLEGMQHTDFNSYKLENRLQDKGGVIDTLTTATGSRCPHCVKIENDIKDKKIKIKNATANGYLEAEVGDGVDISGRMQYHRGTVQKGSCQTITTAGGADIGVVVERKKKINE